MASTYVFVLFACFYLQSYAVVLKKSVTLSNLPISGPYLPPKCGCNAPILPEIIAPIAPKCGCNVPSIGLPNPLIEVPTYFAPAVEVPACGCGGYFSTAVELAQCGGGIPSCGCNSPIIETTYGCGAVDVPAYYYSPPKEVCKCGTPVCGCGKPTCGCGDPISACGSYLSPIKPACGCGVPNCGCGLPTCGCGLSTCGCSVPPFPPVLGCGKYLRQVVVQPPFL